MNDYEASSIEASADAESLGRFDVSGAQFPSLPRRATPVLNVYDGSEPPPNRGEMALDIAMGRRRVPPTEGATK
jgi:hypothetical protein